ncbi:AAA family ATPase [Thalassotalea fonticola]|uniref:AAA family ATPase n=1 Tax=Thalassotalea fonticola TaxID=3065649 RepID=A0ABZ0GQJ6_9GAMM|nr:AAA family ATPase [Colwelliaceae bacterium S1-1]WOH37671.1 AAA family ATPase [Colwelliaceae bacterium S1-1]
MHLSNISIKGYKVVNETSTVALHKGLNVIVGENASGKTSIIDAIRLLLREDEFGFSPVSEKDFHKPFTDNSQPADNFFIQGQFSGLSKDDKVTFLPWYDLKEHATLSLKFENKEKYGRYKKQVWGGSSKSSVFEWELFDKINCIYLPPLRDAEAKLKEGKSSRLAKLLKNLEASAIKDAKGNYKLHKLEERFKVFNDEIATSEDFPIKGMNDKISQQLKDAVGQTFGQHTHISFSEVGFNRIAESLRLFFFPGIEEHENKENYRSLDENSLGHNNLLYLATILAELIDSGEQDERLKVLLVEEPEAHLHPQLQIKLLKYLETISLSREIQVIVTTHSPVLASSATINSLIHICSNNGKVNATPIKDTGLDYKVSIKCETHDGCSDITIPESADFLTRWLDTTKSTLLFAKGIILVEGIAEAFIVPQLAKKILKKYNSTNKPKLPESIDEAGVSVVNMNGIYFKHFMRLFCNFGIEDKESANIPIRCSGMTDQDPEKDLDENGNKTIPASPTTANHNFGKNPALNLIATINKSEYCRLFVGPLKTLEYDLAMEGNNIQSMASVLAENWHNREEVYKELKEISEKDWCKETLKNKAEAANEILKRIEDKNMGKGYFAQLFSETITKNSELATPQYITNAVLWACGGKVSDQ